MDRKTIALAKQVLETVSKSETKELIKLLSYYNDFREDQRGLAMAFGSSSPADDATFEELIKKETQGIMKSAGSQNTYVTTSQDVCRLCGK